MAARVCPCGSPVAEIGARFLCPGCGAPVACWLVADEGRIVAAATTAEILPSAELRDGLRYAARVTWGRAPRSA